MTTKVETKLMTCLKALPCFKAVTKIEEIPSGLSQSSYRVDADNQNFFAKYIENNYLGLEIANTQAAATQQLSPAIYYQDNNWLITAFIQGENLAMSQGNLSEKLTIAIKLMSQCHQLKQETSKLDIKQIIGNLMEDAQPSDFISQNLSLVEKATKEISSLTKANTVNVFCHGDLNFSNILIGSKNRPWLIDFECSCIAPVEFDIAMFIAINELDPALINDICQQYQAYLPNSIINLELIKQFLLCCYFINALWYLNAGNKLSQRLTHTPVESLGSKKQTKLAQLTGLAHQQQKHFNQLAKQ